MTTKQIERAMKAAGISKIPCGIEDAKSLVARHAGMMDAKRGTPAAETKAAVMCLARIAAPELFGGTANAVSQLEIWAKFAKHN